MSSHQTLAKRVIAHLLEISESKCSITEPAILQEGDEDTQQVLAGILTLYETLEFREHKLVEAQSKLEALNTQLDARVKKQADAIMELSTPVIQIWDDVLILPLIGTVDTVRAQQVVEHALSAVANKQASVLIIDITGVPLIDTAVADHLLKTTGAVRLLGATSIITGVSPSNAQTLARLGVELGDIVTKGSMQAGLQCAFEFTNRAVIEGSSSSA